MQKKFLKDLASEMKNMEKEIACMKEKIRTLRAKTDHQENNKLREAVLEDIDEFYEDKKEKTFRKPNLFLS